MFVFNNVFVHCSKAVICLFESDEFVRKKKLKCFETKCNDDFKAITNCEKLRSRPSLDEEAKTTIIGSSGTELAFSFIHCDERIIATVAC